MYKERMLELIQKYYMGLQKTYVKYLYQAAEYMDDYGNILPYLTWIEIRELLIHKMKIETDPGLKGSLKIFKRFIDIYIDKEDKTLINVMKSDMLSYTSMLKEISGSSIEIYNIPMIKERCKDDKEAYIISMLIYYSVIHNIKDLSSLRIDGNGFIIGYTGKKPTQDMQEMLLGIHTTVKFNMKYQFENCIFKTETPKNSQAAYIDAINQHSQHVLRVCGVNKKHLKFSGIVNWLFETYSEEEIVDTFFNDDKTGNDKIKLLSKHEDQNLDYRYICTMINPYIVAKIQEKD